MTVPRYDFHSRETLLGFDSHDDITISRSPFGPADLCVYIKATFIKERRHLAY
jgi:hypothetical protein